MGCRLFWPIPQLPIVGVISLYQDVVNVRAKLVIKYISDTKALIYQVLFAHVFFINISLNVLNGAVLFGMLCCGVSSYMYRLGISMVVYI